MGNKIKIGIIGIGGYGEKIADGILRSKNLILVACCHPKKEVAKKYAEKYNCRPFCNLEEMLKDGGIDAVAIVTPNHLHYEQIITAAGYGKHIFVEKPIANKLQEAEDAIKSCASKNLTLMVGHNLRRSGAIRKIKELMDAKKIGGIVSAELHLSHAGGMKFTKDQWRFYKNKCPGGPLIMLGIHLADVSNYLFGEAENVMARVKKLYAPTETDDTSLLLAELGSGGVVYISSNYNVPSTNFIRVYGTKGILDYDGIRKILTFRAEDINRISNQPELIAYEEKDAVREQMDEFGDCILQNKRPETGGEEAFSALAIIEAAIYSSINNKSASIKKIKSTKERSADNFVKIPFVEKSSFLKKMKTFFRHRDPLKYAIYRHEWAAAPLKNKVRDFPVHLGIEPTNACNLNCVFCARHNIDYKFGYMDFELYKKIIDEGVLHKLRSIKLVRGGESLLHPRFVDMIKYAREKGILDIMFNTNATLLSEEMSRKIIEAGPDLVIFSVDAPEKEIYERQRIGASFEQVEKNTKGFIEMKNKLRPKIKIKTRAHMVYTAETEHLVSKHIKRWAGIVDEVTINKAVEFRKELKNKKFKCRTPFRRLDITWNGDVFVCDPDFDPEGKLLLGNVNNQLIYDLWHGEKMRGLREFFKKNSPNLADPCKYCDGV